MELILARHGNTFEKGNPVYWVGAKEDLPLASFATIQAERIAQALHRLNQIPTVIYSGTLQRTKGFSRLIQDFLNIDLETRTDVRLNEIDYGTWGGKTREAIIAEGHGAALEAWEKEARWPETGWGETEATLRARIHAFAKDLALRHTEKERALIISSNGCLRYFLELIPGALNQHIAHNQFKVATGHCCHLRYSPVGWQLQVWNQDPVTWENV
jgi:probable phosphoglycerate mutase